MTHQDHDPIELPLIETDPAAAGMAHGSALLSPNAKMARALEMPIFVGKPKKDRTPKDISFHLLSENNVDMHEKNLNPVSYDTNESAWLLDNGLYVSAISYANGYAQGLEAFLVEHGYEHLDGFRRDKQLDLKSNGTLTGLSRGLEWRSESYDPFDGTDFLRDFTIGHGTRTGVVAALLKEHGASIKASEAPSTPRELELMRNGSGGKLLFLTNEEIESGDAKSLTDVYKLGLRVWLMDLGIDGVEVDAIIGKNLPAFRYGLEGKDRSDLSVQAVIDPLAPLLFDPLQFNIPRKKASSDRSPNISILPFKIRDIEFDGDLDTDSLYGKEDRRPFGTKYDREIPTKRLNDDDRYSRAIPGRGVDRLGRVDIVDPLSKSAGAYREPVNIYIMPKGSARDAYDLGLKAKAQIDARNAPDPESTDLQA
jgi:hypothetical protein